MGPDGKLTAAPIRVAADGRSLDVGALAALFPVRLASGQNITAIGLLTRPNYAVTADGRFLLNEVVDSDRVSPLRVMLNWDAAIGK